MRKVHNVQWLGVINKFIKLFGMCPNWFYFQTARPSEVLIWKAAITLTVAVWTAHIVGLKPGTSSLLSCLQLSFNRLVAGLVCVWTGFFSM